ncbi:MAG: hypothetical protein OEZ59_03555 [Deltaproteobacteria bacterium]|nr:hypothetical protein [Deltaproteobacteria bacterium]
MQESSEGKRGTEITVYGLMGYAREFRLPLESLDVEDLEPGEEFSYQGHIYQIRSVFQKNDELLINVTMTGSMND